MDMDPSPRTVPDERFYTPRAQASTARSTSSFGTPRSSLPPFSTRESSSSEGTYATPRGFNYNLPPRGYSSSAVQPTSSWPPQIPGGPPRTAQHVYSEQQPVNIHMQHAYPGRYPNPMLTKDRLQQHQYQYRQYTQEQQPLSQLQLQPKQTGQQEQYANSMIDNRSHCRTYDQRDIKDLFRFTRHGRCIEVENLLENRSIPISTEDDNGNTILAVACQNGNKRLVKLALRRGADINASNHRGNTPLMFCFKYGHRALGDYLMSKGADENMMNSDGETCLDMDCS